MAGHSNYHPVDICGEKNATSVKLANSSVIVIAYPYIYIYARGRGLPDGTSKKISVISKKTAFYCGKTMIFSAVLFISDAFP